MGATDKKRTNVEGGSGVRREGNGNGNRHRTMTRGTES